MSDSDNLPGANESHRFTLIFKEQLCLPSNFHSFFSFIVCSLLLFSGYANADKPLKSALDLNTDQAAKVAAIQKEARDVMRKPRGDLHRKQRELRRAKKANDSAAIAKSEKETPPLQKKMKKIHDK